MLLFYAVLKNLVYIITLILPLIISVAFFTLAERKVMAAVQRRKGPNIVGFWGVLQPFADALKLIVKEFIVPSKSKTFIFLISPSLTFFLALISWAVIPFSFGNVFADIYLGVLYLLAASSLGVYGVLLAGWASNSKYAFLGGLRSAAQMISYEVSIGLILLPIVLCSGSLNITDIIVFQEKTCWFVFPMLPLSIIFFISMLAETNRAPFDLPEAEAELVAGFNVEYSSMTFALFFLGEYSSMLLMSAFYICLFFGGWQSPIYVLGSYESFWFSFKVAIVCFLYVFVRANFPRFRYDQLMGINWKVFLPYTLGFLIYSFSLLVLMDGLPFTNLIE